MLLSRPALLFGAFASAVHGLHVPPVQDVLLGHNAYKHLDLIHDLFAFHKNLTQIESITGNEEGVGKWLVDSLTSQGYHVEKQVVSQDPLRFNVLAWPGGKREAEVLISSHIDTVGGISFLDLSELFADHGARSRLSTTTSATATRPSRVVAQSMPREA